jgi:hypothetical protein
MRTQPRASASATAMVLATVVWDCSDERGPNRPTPPQTQPPTPAAALYALSGLVFEVTAAGNTSVDGVEVYCEPCGPPDGHGFRHTDANGVYSFDGTGGVAPGRIQLLVAKRGYVLPDQADLSGASGGSWMGSLSVTVTSDTRYDIQNHPEMTSGKGHQEMLDLVQVDNALYALVDTDARTSGVVEHRFFVGVCVDEVAAVPAVSPQTVLRHRRLTRAGLRREMKRGPRGGR